MSHIENADLNMTMLGVSLTERGDEYFLHDEILHSTYTYKKSAYSKEDIIALFLSTAFASHNDFDDFGEKIIALMDYDAVFKAILNYEGTYSGLPPQVLEDMLSEFLDRDDIIGFLPEKLVRELEESAGVDAYTSSLSGEKQRVFVDMDGTLAEWKQANYEELFERGYFANLKPNEVLLENVRRLATEETVDVYVLSAVLMDSRFALTEKNEWLDKYLPEIDAEHRVFTPCTETVNKADYIPSGAVRPSDILIDDYSNNLNKWVDAGGKGIKVLNGVNSTLGTWLSSGGEYININSPFEELYGKIISLGVTPQNEVELNRT